MSDYRLTIQEWADVVIQIWIRKMEELGINNPYVHARSFYNHVMANAGGDVARIQFAFEYFLKFTDMGVGKGVNLSNQNNSKRKPKMWFSKTFLLEVKKLGNMLASKYAHEGVLYVKETLEDK
jgi:hypothetical protein